MLYIPNIYQIYIYIYIYICIYINNDQYINWISNCVNHEAITAKEGFENSIHHNDTTKIITKAYLNNPVFLLHEAVDHILSDLTIERILVAKSFVYTNLPEEIVWVLLFEK